MKKVLDEILRSNGVSVPSLVKLAGRGEASIYGFAVEEGKDERTIWWRLRELRKVTRHWPVFLGDSDDVADLVDRLQFHSIADVREIIRKARDMDLQAWKEKTALEILDDEFSSRASHERYLAGINWIPCGGKSSNPYIGLIPYSEGWQTAAFLNFGAWSPNPEPQVHCKLFRRWNRLVGAEVFSVTKENVGLIIHSPPKEKTLAAEIRLELFCYCPSYGLGITKNDGFFENILGAPFWNVTWSSPYDVDMFGAIDLEDLFSYEPGGEPLPDQLP